MELLCDFDFEIKHIQGKENQVVDTLNKNMHEMHVVAIITCQSYLM